MRYCAQKPWRGYRCCLRTAAAQGDGNLSLIHILNYLELINPEIIGTEGEQTGAEGCLSVPGICGTVSRPNFVKVRAQDRNGNHFEVGGEGLTARAFCHEIDHLDGILFTDKVIDYIED